jgi:hypothetical protein
VLGKTSNVKENTEEGTKIEDQEAPADGIHGDHSDFPSSEGKPAKRRAKDQRDDTTLTTKHSGDATGNKTDRTLVYQPEDEDKMDCGRMAEDIPDAADKPMLTMRPPDNDMVPTSGREERDGRGDKQEIDKGRPGRLQHPSEDEIFLAIQSTSTKRTKKLKVEMNGVQPQKRKRNRVKNALPKNV